MKFEKYHGLGNDFIITEEAHLEEIKDVPELVRVLCDRRTGIGADGMIMRGMKDGRHEMIFYNADGTTDTMCGNGYRCFCLYLINNGHVEEKEISVHTGAGIIEGRVLPGEDYMIRVAMGEPVYDHPTFSGSMRDRRVEILDREFILDACFVGTPHIVVEVDELTEEILDRYAPHIERMPEFPEGTSVNFVKKVSGDTLRILTWERGVGRTLACGTGSCASATVMRDRGRLDSSRVVVKHRLGELLVDTGEEIFMTGGGERVAEGRVDISRFRG